MGLPLLEGSFRSLTGRKVGPAFLFVFVEAAEKGYVRIERTKFGEGDGTAGNVHNTRVKLTDQVEQSVRRSVEISAADVSGIGKQLGLCRTTALAR